MIYQLKAAITGTISEAWLGVSRPEELSAEALTAYQKEIHQRIQYVMDEEPDVERRDPFAGCAKLKEAVEHLHVDAVTEEGKLWACIQAVTQGSLTVGEEKELEVFMQEEFSYGFGEMFPPVKVPEGWVHFRLQEPESCAFTRQNKYEITNIPHPKYPWLHRIRALVHVNERIPAGILGGFVESEANLSQEGKCWVYDNAVCCERAVVEKDAGLFDGAMARASALVTGDACLYDRTVAEGNCCIRRGEIKEDARIAGDAVINESVIDGLSPLIAGQCSVYGEVRGLFVIKDNILPGETLVNPTEDLFILEHGKRDVLIKERKLEPPQKYVQQQSAEKPKVPSKKKKQPER